MTARASEVERLPDIWIRMRPELPWLWTAHDTYREAAAARGKGERIVRYVPKPKRPKRPKRAGKKAGRR